MINTVKAAFRSQAAEAGNAILVIDDNFAIRNALTDILNLILGIPVFTAANGHEGLQIYQQQQQNIALILLDMNMPVMNGEQTYKKLRQISPQVKVIISSSLSHAEADRRLGEREMPVFLRKPYDTATLLGAVQSALTSVEMNEHFPIMVEAGKTAVSCAVRSSPANPFKNIPSRPRLLTS